MLSFFCAIICQLAISRRVAQQALFEFLINRPLCRLLQVAGILQIFGNHTHCGRPSRVRQGPPPCRYPLSLPAFIKRDYLKIQREQSEGNSTYRPELATCQFRK